MAIAKFQNSKKRQNVFIWKGAGSNFAKNLELWRILFATFFWIWLSRDFKTAKNVKTFFIWEGVGNSFAINTEIWSISCVTLFFLHFFFQVSNMAIARLQNSQNVLYLRGCRQQFCKKNEVWLISSVTFFSVIVFQFSNRPIAEFQKNQKSQKVLHLGGYWHQFCQKSWDLAHFIFHIFSVILFSSFKEWLLWDFKTAQNTKTFFFC